MISPQLRAGLDAYEPCDRRAAAQEIGESGDPAALGLMLERLRMECSRSVKEALLRGISGIRLAGADKAIVELLSDEDPFVRAEAAAMLQNGAETRPESADQLELMLKSEDKDLRKFAIEILATAAGLPDLFYLNALKDNDINIVVCAIERIGFARRTSLAAAVLAIALDEQEPQGHPMVLCACLETLALIGSPETLAALRGRFPDACLVPELFLTPFFKVLGRSAGPEAVKEICRTIVARGAEVYQPAIDGLTRISSRHRLIRLNQECEETLCTLLNARLDAQLRFHLIRLLGHFATSERVALALLPYLGSPDAQMRLLTIESLASSEVPLVEAALRSLLAGESVPEMRREMEERLGRRPSWNSQPNSSPS